MEKLNVIRCLVISPQDVQAEREVIVRAIDLWNAQIGKALQVLIHPVRWETHAVPSLGAPPQELLNAQIVSGCDCAVAIFWSRLGTPTKKAASGSMEEISTILKRGGHILVYKCTRDIPLGILSTKQIAALEKELTILRKRGLVFEYDSNERLQILLLGHLTGIANAMSGSGLPPDYEKETKKGSTKSIPDIRIKATWGIPTGMGPVVQSLLCIAIQNHSDRPFHYDSLSLELDNRKTMVPRVDAFGRPLPGSSVIDSGASLSFYLDFSDLFKTAADEDTGINAVLVKDQIGREFRSSKDELDIALANFEKWEKS